MDTFGERLAKLRKYRGFKSRGTLADKIGVSHVSLGAWEKDEYIPNGKNIDLLATILKTTTHWLHNGDSSALYDPERKSEFDVDEKVNKVVAFASKALSDDSATYLGHVDAWDSNTPLDEDDVEVPFYMDVELAAGSGSDLIQENHGYKLRFSKSTLKRCGVDARSAACVKVSGNSMEPRLYDGDVVGVDTTKKNIIDGKIYAINHDGMLRVKRLYRLPGNGIRVNSLNTAEFPDETYDAQQAQNIHIIGKVFWHSSIWD